MLPRFNGVHKEKPLPSSHSVGKRLLSGSGHGRPTSSAQDFLDKMHKLNKMNPTPQAGEDFRRPFSILSVKSAQIRQHEHRKKTLKRLDWG
jgi:hypothetical protein